jgi:hypothetical protein
MPVTFKGDFHANKGYLISSKVIIYFPKEFHGEVIEIIRSHTVLILDIFHFRLCPNRLET